MSAGLQAARFDLDRAEKDWDHWQLAAPVTIRPGRGLEYEFPNGIAALAWLKSCFGDAPAATPAALRAPRSELPLKPLAAVPPPAAIARPVPVPGPLALLIEQVVRATWCGDPSGRAWLAGPSGRAACATVEKWLAENGNAPLGDPAAGPVAQGYANDSGRLALRMVQG
jgi:hypothetical protein